MKFVFAMTLLAASLVSAEVSASDEHAVDLRAHEPLRPAATASAAQNEALTIPAAMTRPTSDTEAGSAFLAFLVVVRAEAAAERQKR